MTTKSKLILGALTLIGSSAYLAYVGAATSWQYYVHVDECVADVNELRGHRVRVNGRVELGSLHISEDRQQATFVLGGQRHKINVTAVGTLPDNLQEDMDVVVEGTLDSDRLQLQGRKVITRCASKYQSP